MAMPLLPGRAPPYCSAVSFINLDRIQTGQQTPDNDHKIDRRFLFGQKLRCTLLVIQLFVNFLAYYCNHTVIDSVNVIQCHLTSSFQLVDVAGIRSCDL